VYVCDFSGLDITYDGVIVKGNTLIIKDIVALGILPSHLGKVVSCSCFLILRHKYSLTYLFSESYASRANSV